MTPNEILSLSHAAFHQLVDDDLRARPNIDRSTSEALRTPQVVGRWHTTLAQMSKKAEMQQLQRDERFLAERAAFDAELILKEQALAGARRGYDRNPDDEERLVKWNEAEDGLIELQYKIKTHEAEYRDKRAKTLRFRSSLEVKLVEATSIREGMTDEGYASLVAKERNFYLRRAEDLETAIRGHRDELMAEDEPSEIDKKLWSAL